MTMFIFLGWLIAFIVFGVYCAARSDREEQEWLREYTRLTRLQHDASCDCGKQLAPTGVTAGVLFSEPVCRELLDQMRGLQQDYLRPEIERQSLHELIFATQRTQESLCHAVEQLSIGAANLQQLKCNVDGLKRHEPPAGVVTELDRILCQQTAALKDLDALRQELSQQLQEKRNALAELHGKHVVTPEEAISSADHALAEAAGVKHPE